jgi:glycosyltransferase involved in cell wall biosynthesis/GT2 family glycosyltransferase
MTGETARAVSVIVPFHGRKAEANTVLERLQKMDLGPGGEAILVDNTPAGVVVGLSSGAVRVIAATREESSYYARNAGAEAARNPWLLFLDADCEPDAELVARYAEEVARAGSPQLGALAGSVLPAPGQRSLLATYATSRGHVQAERHLRGPLPPAGITANLLVRGAAWEAIGGFQEGIRSAGDIEFSWRLQEAGWELRPLSSAVVFHSYPRRLRPMLGKAVRYGSGRAWLDRRYRGRSPRPRLARPLARCAAGTIVWTVALQPRRALYKAIDAAWLCADAYGYARVENRSPQRGRARDGAKGVRRLLVMTDNFPARSETFVLAELRELRRLGFGIRIESSARPKLIERAAQREFSVAYLEDDPTLLKLGSLAWLVGRHPLRSIADLRQRRRWRREEAVWPLRALAPAARRAARAGEAQIHVHFAAGAALNALRIGRLLAIPYSLTAHAYDIYREPRNLPEKLRAAAFVTSGCDYTVRHLRELGGDGAAVHRIVMGIDPAALRRSRPYPGGGTVVGVGRLIEKKGFEYLVEAAGLLGSASPLKGVVIVGDGPRRAALRELISRHGLERVVELAGWRDPAAVGELLEGADLLAMPCVVAADGDRDSMPVAVKEAMAMEVPVVASDEVGLPELVRPPWGRLVPPRDAKALAAAIAELLALPSEERVAMGRAGRAHVIEHANVERETAKLAALLQGTTEG